MPDARQWWIIDVAGYGTFATYGTVEEAEDMRAHKAKWEGGVGRKRPAVTTDASDTRLVESRKDMWRSDHADGVELEPNEREALGL